MTNSLIFGSPSLIAIECADLYTSDDGQYQFGRIRLLVKNTPVGNFDQFILIGSILLWLKEFAAFVGRRYHETLRGKSDEECLAIIMSELYGEAVDDSIPYETYKQIEFCPKVSPSFDGDKAILVDYDDHSKFIYKPFESTAVDSVTLEKGYLEDVVKQFVEGVTARR